MQVVSKSVDFAAVRTAAVALVQALIRPEYALHVVSRTSLSQVPDEYTPLLTTQVHSFVYSLWEHRLQSNRLLLRLEGVGIFSLAYEDEEPGEVAAVVQSFSQAA